MQTVSNTWQQLFSQPGHITEVKAVIAGQTYGMDMIYSATQTRGLFSKNNPMIGCCCASTLEIKLIPQGKIPRMAAIGLSTRLKSADGSETSEWIPAGTYFIDTRKKEYNGEKITFTAYDSMLKADQPYLSNSAITNWPADESDVVDEIADLMGITVDSRTVLAGYDVDYPNQDWTMREVLGWIAAANGGNWIITPTNELYLVPFSGETSLLSENQSTAILFGDSLIVLSTGIPYDDIGTDSENIYKNARSMQNLGLLQPFTGVKLWYDRENSYVDQTETVGGETTTEKVEQENAYTAGDDTGRVLEADCPWATQAMADAILANIDGYCYQGAVVEYAEITPAAEMGDTVVCDGVAFSLAQASVTFDGAYAPTISAPADEEVDYEYRYESETQRQLNRKATLGENYYGFRVTRENGIEVVNIVDGVETTRMILNSSIQAFYNANGDEALYFDAEAGIYRFVGDVTVLSGSLNINNNFIVDTEGNVTTNGNVTLQGENTKIIAPMILADSFDVFPEDATDTEIEALTIPNGFNLYGRSAGNLYNFLNISQYGENAVFDSPAGGYAYWDFDRTNISGKMYYAGSGQSGSNAEIATLGDIARSTDTWTPVNASSPNSSRNYYVIAGGLLVINVCINLSSSLSNLSEVAVCSNVDNEMGVTVSPTALVMSTAAAVLGASADLMVRLIYNNGVLSVANRSGASVSTSRTIYGQIVLGIS